MIIYTNEGNPLGLKLLICAKLAKKEVTVKIVNLTDKEIQEPLHLPTLQLDTGIQLFSSDAAAKYLLQTDENIGKLNQWMEWTTTRLAPALVHNFAAGHRADSKAHVILNQLVKTLNDTLSKSLFLTGTKITSADIAVWSLLSPDGTLKGAHDIDSLLIWYNNIAEIAEVKAALEILSTKNLHFDSLQHSNKYGGLHHIVLESSNGDDPNILADSPNQLADTISIDEIEMAKNNFIYLEPKETKPVDIVLPIPGKRNVLITSALPYVNNVPHLGNIIGCVLSADFFARYSRIVGYNTLYIGGTDEYGTATETKALAEKTSPQDVCDKYFVIHDNIYKWFGIGFDYFGRTTTPEQTEIVQSLFSDLLMAGFMFTQSVDQLLCINCNRYLADRFVEGTCPHIGCGYEDARGDQCDGCGKLVNAIELIRPRCKTCNTAPVVRQSNQFFIDLPKIEPRLREWLKTSDVGWSSNARTITKSWLREGLLPRCITRDLKWGIPVPYEGFEDKVFYVWFDAPIGYLSITNKYTKEWRQWWQPKDKNTKVELFQFMAKDNVPFHSVMFPSTLLGVDKGYTLVSHIMATEYLNYEDGKFSKSRGTGVFGNDAQDTGISSDVWRFYLASSRPEGQDSSFSWNDLVARNNSELLNNLGNFINRSLVFCEKNFSSSIPTITLNDDDLALLALVNREIKEYVHAMERAKFRDGVRHILSVSRHGNQYMQFQQPWVLLKGTDDQKSRAATVIGLSCNLVSLLATLLSPFMPETSGNIYMQLNINSCSLNPEKPQMSLYLKTGHKIGKPVPLFSKIEQAKLDELKLKYGGPQVITKPEQTSENQVFNTVAEAEKAVAQQSEKVRAIKSSGVEKAVWQPEVTILLNLKKQLTPLQITDTKQSETKVVEQPVICQADTLKDLEDQILKQGEKVRLLKSNADKNAWTPEVNILLALKKQLAGLTGAGVAEPKSGKNKKKK